MPALLSSITASGQDELTVVVYFDGNFGQDIRPLIDGEQGDVTGVLWNACPTGTETWVFCVGIAVTIPAENIDDTQIGFVSLLGGEIVGRSETHTAREWDELY